MTTNLEDIRAITVLIENELLKCNECIFDMKIDIDETYCKVNVKSLSADIFAIQYSTDIEHIYVYVKHTNIYDNSEYIVTYTYNGSGSFESNVTGELIYAY